MKPPQPDRLRQALNLVFAFTPIAVTVLGELTGANRNFDGNTTAEPYIVPAGYAFAIWSLIYGGSFAYGIYQAMPRQRENPLLRRIGGFTASNLIAITVWLFAAQNRMTWLTVICIVWSLLSLIGAFGRMVRYPAPLTRWEKGVIVFPISIYLGWITVATVANTAAWLKELGLTDVLLTEVQWTVLMVVAAGVIASGVTLVSRGNLTYALTLIWAFIAIVVANVTRQYLPSVAITAALMAVGVAVALVRGRMGARLSLVR